MVSLRIITSTTFLVSVSLVAASPMKKESAVSLPLHKKVAAASPFPKTILAVDSARLARLKSTATLSSDNAIATNLVDQYVVAVNVGSQTFHNMVIDTGSSNTWVGADTTFSAGLTGKSTGKSVEVRYGSGSFNGTEYTDTVSLGGLIVTSQSIGVALSSSGFEGTDGIIGFGPTDLTKGTVSGSNTVPTFMNNLYSQGTIFTEVLGIYFADESGSDTNDANGVLTLGGTDASLYSGSITYTDRVGNYWGVEVSEVSYGGSDLGSISQAIVDTGTTLIYLPTSVYNKFLSDSGGSLDKDSGLVRYTSEPTENLTFTIGGTIFAMTPTDYLVPKGQYKNFGLSRRYYYSYVNDGGDKVPDAVLGMYFLTNFYSVFDT